MNTSDKSDKISQENLLNIINILKSDINKWNQLRNENPEWIPKIEGIDLSDCNLREANLTNVSFANSNLGKVVNLQSKQLGGANLDGTILPEYIKFEGLQSVQEISKNASNIFIAMLTFCLFCWLTIAKISDCELITNSVNSQLPIINTTVPIIGFFIFGPLFLLSFYIYFHLYLRNLWREFSELPAYFPDGKSLDQKSYSWLVNDLIRFYFVYLKDKNVSFLYVERIIVVLLAWWSVPTTIGFFWYRYLCSHDIFFTFIHWTIFLISLIFCILFLTDFKQQISFKINQKPRLNLKNLPKITVNILTLFIIIISFIISLQIETKNKNLIQRFFNANLSGKDLSIKPINWSNYEQFIELTKGVNLKGKNLNYVNADNSFLIKANLDKSQMVNASLIKTNLSNANLVEANLENTNFNMSNLSKADLNKANMRNVDFVESNLKKSNLSWAWLSDSNFTEANLEGALIINSNLDSSILLGSNLSNANLSGSSFKHSLLIKSDMKNARLIQTNLVEADLTGSKLINADLTGANLSYAKLLEVNLEGAKFFQANLNKVNINETSINTANFNGAFIDYNNYNQFFVKNYRFIKFGSDEIEQYKKYFDYEPDEDLGILKLK